ncbi:hypothetical protein BDN72DRAFT_905296 [Pluteus cervinus]|uniref:Uncharacterized protein n=1 Tax=Pluteus cervinus TaxID=181527 RepID=A0ACD3A3U4_9AGAR|nr:hypothetical protein BDN72DRAFT_905296 [Pluteus cervinus]
MLVLAPLVSILRYSLEPIPPFTWFGLQISSLDVAAAFRLCLLLRQVREALYKEHVSTKGHDTVEEASFVKSASTTLMVVYGGEAIVAPFLGITPSFMISGTVPTLYTIIQAVVDYLPSVPSLSVQTELPLAFFDGIARAYLLCNIIPPVVTKNVVDDIAESPWTLLVTSLVMANAGFFFTNLLSFLNPTPLSVQTPPELKPYGWTTVDLWCAPTITAIYSLLTHTQPFWADLHTVIVEILGGATSGKTVEPVDPETARVLCALLLSTLFAGRTAKNFGLLDSYFPKPKPDTKGKQKVQ